MKVGILTWFAAMNYGAQAQTYALANVIRDMGHTCEEIAYYPHKLQITNIKSSLNIEKHWFFNIRQTICSIIRMFQLQRVIKSHKKSRKIRKISDIDKQRYDVIIIGSDEVVNCKHPLNEAVYFGVGIEHTPVMFYAPSSGALNSNHELPYASADSIKTFIGLSGRDEHTCDFLTHNCERDVVQVVDPTLLYDFKDLIKRIDDDKYILLYSFDSLEPYKAVIVQYAHDNNLKIISLGRYCKWADKSSPYASESEWLSYYCAASLVITDSFHGLIFSIKNNIEFVLLGRGDKINKNSDLLNELDIQRRYFSGNQSIEEYLRENPMDYELVNLIIKSKVKKSREYIQKSLEKIG